MATKPVPEISIRSPAAISDELRVMLAPETGSVTVVGAACAGLGASTAPSPASARVSVAVTRVRSRVVALLMTDGFLFCR